MQPRSHQSCRSAPWCEHNENQCPSWPQHHQLIFGDGEAWLTAASPVRLWPSTSVTVRIRPCDGRGRTWRTSTSQDIPMTASIQQGLGMRRSPAEPKDEPAFGFNCLPSRTVRDIFGVRLWEVEAPPGPESRRNPLFASSQQGAVGKMVL